jgi:hypothetical protein
MKNQNDKQKRRGPGESEASSLEQDDRNMTHGPGSPAGNHAGSPMGSRGDNKAHHAEKKEMGGSRTSKK